MGLGFAGLCGQSLNIFFMEDETGGGISHDTLRQRLGWEENNHSYARFFVRFQISDYNMSNFEFDEGSTLPGWAEGAEFLIREKAEKLLGRVKPLMNQYISDRQKINRERDDFIEANENTDSMLFDQAMAGFEKRFRELYEAYIDAHMLIPGYQPPPDYEHKT
jgi:DNA-binding transcriptional regulator YdaS (Cro superfamily)